MKVRFLTIYVLIAFLSMSLGQSITVLVKKLEFLSVKLMSVKGAEEEKEEADTEKSEWDDDALIFNIPECIGFKVNNIKSYFPESFTLLTSSYINIFTPPPLLS